MAGVAILDAARRLGVAQDTVRRRIRSLLLFHHPSESLGGRLLMGLEQVQARPTPLHGRGIGRPSREGAGEYQVLHELVSILQEQLDARTREISELHQLLAARALNLTE